MRKAMVIAGAILVGVVGVVVYLSRQPGGSSPSPGAGSAQPSARPLAGITDLNEFTTAFQAVRNPHIQEAARFLTDSHAGLAPERAKEPGPDNNLRIQAYPLRAALWPDPNIQTCWENPTPEFSTQMAAVRQAIADTWEAASRLRFTGWGECPPASPPNQPVVRIQIDDSSADNGPRTLGLGRQLAGVPHGMLLNFTFLRWGTACQTMSDYCIKAIAVHEFGHGIGFAHEQNRPDKPGECLDAPQGSNGDDTSLTPYDPNSVMNYCNKKYNNDGNLSDLDKQAVQQLYGAHQ